MKYCCTPTKKKFTIKKKAKVGLALILAGVLCLFFLVDNVIRGVISGYPLNVASGIMREIMDEAMDNVLTEAKLEPKLIDKVIYSDTGHVISIETDTTELTKIKTAFTKELGRLLNDYGNVMTVSIPIGTLIGNEYTLGRGPKVSFDLQYSWSVETVLQSTFYEAGINNTVHSIELVVTNHINIIIPWGHSGRDISTKYIVAETVIIGEVPDAFTNIHGASDEITDDVIDFGAKVE